MVGILPSNAMGESSISSLGARCQQNATMAKKQRYIKKKKKQGNVGASSMGTLKMVHIK